MIPALWVVSVVLAFVCGGALYGLFLTESGLDEEDRRELQIVRHEVGVLIRVVEEAGIKFNRDNDRNVTGLQVDMVANLVGQAKVNSG